MAFAVRRTSVHSFAELAMNVDLNTPQSLHRPEPPTPPHPSPPAQPPDLPPADPTRDPPVVPDMPPIGDPPPLPGEIPPQAIRVRRVPGRWLPAVRV